MRASSSSREVPPRGPADYEATKLVLGKLEDAFSPYWKTVASCTGSATIAKDRVVLTLTAPEACARWSGTWTAEHDGARLRKVAR